MKTIDRTSPHKTVLTSSAIDQDIVANFTLDRSFNDNLELPFDFDQVKVKPNEFATSDNVNASLYKLYYNFLYLNSRCKLASGQIPATFNGVLTPTAHPTISLTDTFVLGNHHDISYFINGQQNPTLTLVRGGTYIFKNASTGHPFYISTGVPNQPCDTNTVGDCRSYNHGVTSMGARGPEESLIFKVPMDAPSTLYYYSAAAPATMTGTIKIADNFNIASSDISPICTEDIEVNQSSNEYTSIVQYGLSGQCADNLAISDLIVRAESLIGAESLKWQTGYTSNAFCDNSYLSDVRSISIIDTEYSYGNFYLMFLATADHLLVLEVDFKGEFSPAIREYSKNVEKVNDIVFEDISSIAIGPNKNLYIADKRQNKIYQYSIDNFTTNNLVMRKRGKILSKSIGGHGTDRARERFDNPISIKIDKNGNVYVLDFRKGGNSSIKVYDENLNWLKTITKKGDFQKETLVDFALEPESRRVYVLTDTGKVLVYDKATGDLLMTHSIMDIYGPGASQRKFKRIEFSRESPDVVYIVNDRDVLKQWVSRLNSGIGYFQFSKFGIDDIDIQNFAIYQGTAAPNDTVFVHTTGKEYTKCSKLFRFTDSLNYISLIYDQYKEYSFSFDQVKIKPQEFVTNLTINKSLLKLFYNHTLFRDNLHSVYSGLYDEEGFGQFGQLRYLTGSRADIYDFEVHPEDLVGINEIPLAAVINRCLKQLYDFQNQILHAIQPEYLNFYPLAADPIILRGVTERSLPAPPPDQQAISVPTGITSGTPMAAPPSTTPIQAAPPVPPAPPLSPGGGGY